MRRRVRRYRANPSLVIYNPPSWVQNVVPTGEVVQCLSEDVHEIKYQHADDGEWYSHKFEPGVDLYAVNVDGQHSIVIVGRDGQNVWENFDE